MRDRCMLYFTREQVALTGAYCEKHSSPLPGCIQEQLLATDRLSKDETIMAPTLAQCAWLMNFARLMKPKRILELGTFTGVSALVFYEGTRKIEAKITTIDMSETYLKMAEEAFCRAGATDRIELLRGRCLDLLPTLKGDFDLIYIDAAEEEYKAYTSFILDNKLLSPDGVILVDDVLLEGLVLDRSIAQGFPSEIQEPYLAIADMINDFNAYLASDPRIEVTVLPLFNGITQIMWK